MNNINENKYYSHEYHRPLNFEHDGCPLASYRTHWRKALYAEHPKGFLIFLRPDQIESCDEYAASDPYTVEENIQSDFHKRRLDLTITLLNQAAANCSNPKVLDLGCGQGHITASMQLQLPGAEISGLDYSMSAIEFAHDRFPGIDFVVGDAYNLPYAISYFDVVVCNNLWEHIPDPLFLLEKISTIMKPDGYLIISTPSRYRFENLMNVIRGRPVTFLSRQHVTEYSVGQVCEQLRYGGFDVVTLTSRPIKLGSLKANIVRKLLSGLIKMVGSHHQLEATVFYLLRKKMKEISASVRGNASQTIQVKRSGGGMRQEQSELDSV